MPFVISDQLKDPLEPSEEVCGALAAPFVASLVPGLEVDLTAPAERQKQLGMVQVEGPQVETVGGVRMLSDRLEREFPGESLSEGDFGEPGLVWSSTCELDGDRTAAAVCGKRRPVFRVPPGEAYVRFPSFAGVEFLLIYIYGRSSLPYSFRSSTRTLSPFLRTPPLLRCWSRGLSIPHRGRRFDISAGKASTHIIRLSVSSKSRQERLRPSISTLDFILRVLGRGLHISYISESILNEPCGPV